jgi:tetratricopeptide (TPR) repeat protein
MPRKSISRPAAVIQTKQKASPKWLQPMLLLAALVFFAALFSGEIRDTDVCWHLKTGEHIWATHALPIPDPFSYTTAMSTPRYAGEQITRNFNLTHEWLAQISMYLIYAVAGFPGLVLARMVLLTFFCAIIGWICLRRSNSFYMGLAGALAAGAITFYFQQSRPFLATFVFAAITLAIFESRRWMWMLPAIFFVWANLHGGFFIGWLICTVYCGEAIFRRLRQKPVVAERELWMVSVAACAASAINPNGLRVMQVLWLYRSSAIQMNNLEWQRPMFWEPGIFSFLLGGALVALLLAYRRTRPVDWLLYVGFAALSLMAVRNTIFMGLAGPVVMAAYVTKRHAAGITASLALAAGIFVLDIKPAIASHNIFALRLAEWQFPAGAADFLQAHGIRGRMFNNYEAGGYLVWRLWPLQRDFIDGRGLSEDAYDDYKRILYSEASRGDSQERLLQKYGIEVLVLEGFDYLSGQVYPLGVSLADAHNSEWKLVYTDAQSVLFMRHPPAEIGPSQSADALLQSLESQCEQHIQHDPSRPRCAFGLGELYAHRGNTDKASQWIAYYLDRHAGPDKEAEQISQSLRVTALNNQALSLESTGDFAAAEPLFRQALAAAERTLGPRNLDTAGALNNLASLLEAKGDYDGAEALFRRALAICEDSQGPNDPHTATALDNLAGVLEAKGDYNRAEMLYRRALAIAMKALGPDDGTTNSIRDDLEELLKKKSKP